MRQSRADRLVTALVSGDAKTSYRLMLFVGGKGMTTCTPRGIGRQLLAKAGLQRSELEQANKTLDVVSRAFWRAIGLFIAVPVLALILAVAFHLSGPLWERPVLEAMLIAFDTTLFFAYPYILMSSTPQSRPSDAKATLSAFAQSLTHFHTVSPLAIVISR